MLDPVTVAFYDILWRNYGLVTVLDGDAGTGGGEAS
jgi:hypothetical protein